MKLGLSMTLLAVAGWSCGGGSDPHYTATGMLGIPSSTVVGANLVFADVTFNGNSQVAPYGALIDSGSPVVLLDPTYFSLPAPPNANDVQTQLDLGLVRDGNVTATLQKIPAVQISAAMMDEIGFAGILGGNVMRDFSMQLDYAAPMNDAFCLGCVAGARDDAESPGASVPFTLRGGGTGPLTLSSTVTTTVDTPPTRIPVTVTLDGTDYTFMLDTGASEVSVRSTVFSAMVQDGRSVLEGFPITTVMGNSGASVARSRTITVGGQTVLDAPVMTIPGDALLNFISQEVYPSGNQHIDGLLGGSYLRNFVVTVDYPKRQLHLQLYNTQTWVDEFKRVGIGLGQTASTAKHWYAVANVYPGTDAAAKGIDVGNEVISVDGMSLDGLDPIAADALLNGTVGTSKTLLIAASDSATPVSVSVGVDDLIPSPAPQ